MHTIHKKYIPLQPYTLSESYMRWKYCHLLWLFMKGGENRLKVVMKGSDEFLKLKGVSNSLRMQILYLNGLVKRCFLKFDLALSAFRDMCKCFNTCGTNKSGFNLKFCFRAMPYISACLIAKRRLEQGLHLAREGLNRVEMLEANIYFEEFFVTIICINTFKKRIGLANNNCVRKRFESKYSHFFKTIATLALQGSIQSPQLLLANQMVNSGLFIEANFTKSSA